jgi:hypothetical protein
MLINNIMLQSVLFSKDYFKPMEAIEWLKRANISPIKKMHTTYNFYRFRINEPAQGKYYTKHIAEGVIFVFII